MLKNKKIILILSTIFLVFSLSPMQHAFADPIPFWDSEAPADAKDRAILLTDDDAQRRQNINAITDNAQIVIDGSGVETLKEDAKNFTSMIAALMFGFAVIMVVFAGFTYTTSEGDERKTRQAKTQILMAGIGIGIALFNLTIVELFTSIINVFN